MAGKENRLVVSIPQLQQGWILLRRAALLHPDSGAPAASNGNAWEEKMMLPHRINLIKGKPCC